MVPANYFEILGRFTHSYSGAESILNLAFHKFIGLPPELAHIIKGKLPAGKLVSVTKEIMPFSKLSEEHRAIVIGCLQQLEHISAFRHTVIHRGAQGDESGGLFTTNVPSMKSPESYEITAFTLADIQSATVDLDCISIKLTSASFPDQGFDPKLIPLLLAPWRYKPVQGRRPNSPPRPPKPQAQKRPPKASRP